MFSTKTKQNSVILACQSLDQTQIIIIKKYYAEPQESRNCLVKEDCPMNRLYLKPSNFLSSYYKMKRQ